MERAKGLEGNNFLTIAMKEKGLTMQGAADFIGDEVTLRVNQSLVVNVKNHGDDADANLLD